MIPRLVGKDLINLHVNAQNQSELLASLSEYLLEKDYVLESFKEAIVSREKEYPTGLQLENIAVAIPHTYAQHVKKPFIFINRLERPVSFIQMGTDDELLDVHYVMVLGISQPEEQTSLLSELMALFSDQSFIQALESTKDQMAVYQLFADQKNQEDLK
ncbi:PTS sugar transporter subunit IIA [Streptococcus catagoni]|uniref:PTS sugar transporter subunit IIA n=1 Tax=Streptococcus catagoni TaxID=2654874 RepID=UPI00140920C5